MSTHDDSKLQASRKSPAGEAAGGPAGKRRERLEVESARTRKAERAVRDEMVGGWVQEASQPRQWSWPSERRLLGERITRVDGPVKATGRARYAFDVNRPRMVYGKILRSPHAHARVVSIDTSAAEAAPGVVAVLEVAEAGGRVRYHGDGVAAVAAETEARARDARDLIEVEYEVLDHVSTEEEAMAPGAPQVHEDGNVNVGRLDERGDLEAGFAAAEAVFEGTFRMEVETHSSLETHGVVAEWDGDDVTVWASTQGVHSVKDGLAGYLEIPATNVHVITSVMGGGFGSKLSPSLEDGVAARLARLADRPVKLMLERDEEHLDSGNRPSAVAWLRAGADAEGRLTAFEADTYGTGGIGRGANFPLPYIYATENDAATRRQHANVYVNGGNARAMRAPGHPQGSFVMEAVMDELANRLGMDPVEFRKRNLAADSLWHEQLDRGAAEIGWADDWHPPGDPSPGPIKRGLGCAISVWGSGGGGTQATCTIHPDGSVVMTTGTQDIGTGTRTVVAIVTAEILGLEVDDVTVQIGQSDYPYSGGSGGSTTVPSVAPAVRVTAGLALEQLFERIAPGLGVEASELEAGVGEIRVAGGGGAWSWREACRQLGTRPVEVNGEWQPGLSDRGVNGAQFAAVTVDTGTGIVTVDRLVGYHDCGLVVDELTAESQVNGGMIMGIGYALFEERVLDPQTGRMVNADFERYMLPGPSDMPEFGTHMMDTPERGVLGLGEPPTIPTAAAIGNAVANAIGVRVRSLPITPDKVLAALEEGPEATVRPARFDWFRDHVGQDQGV